MRKDNREHEHEIQMLTKRINRLTAENAALRRELELRDAIGEAVCDADILDLPPEVAAARVDFQHYRGA